MTRDTRPLDPEDQKLRAGLNELARVLRALHSSLLEAVRGDYERQHGPVGGPFALTDQNGRAVTEESYRGKAVLIFFGFTHCPDVCPTELTTLAAAMDQLGGDAARTQPLFITIDPERDTPQALADYVSLFHPSLAGLTGTPEQVAKVARTFRVYYAKVTPPGTSDYLMDHSAFVYLLGPDGALRALFRPGVTPEELAGAVRQVLG